MVVSSNQIEEIKTRNHAEELAARNAHARELAEIVAGQRSGGHGATIVVTILTLLSTIVAVVAIAFALRSKPAPQPIVTAPRVDNMAELESTKREIAALKKEVLALTQKPIAPAPTLAIAPKPQPRIVPRPQPSSTGTTCPPGVQGVPMCS
jgi:hypothetical protein